MANQNDGIVNKTDQLYKKMKRMDQCGIMKCTHPPPGWLYPSECNVLVDMRKEGHKKGVDFPDALYQTIFDIINDSNGVDLDKVMNLEETIDDVLSYNFLNMRDDDVSPITRSVGANSSHKVDVSPILKVAEVCNTRCLDLDHALEYVGINEKKEKYIHLVKAGSMSLQQAVMEAGQCVPVSTDETHTNVFYVKGKNTVIKFMAGVKEGANFLREVLFSSITNNVEGVVANYWCCPEGLCIAMPVKGLSMSLFKEGSEPSEKTLRLLRRTIDQACGKLSNIEDNVELYNVLYRSFLKYLPYILNEIVNVCTRLSSRYINLMDIKASNVVLDPQTMKPFFVDLEHVAFTHSNFKRMTRVNARKCLQVPPDKVVDAKSMTWGLASLVQNVLVRHMHDSDFARSMYFNMPYIYWYTGARCLKSSKRPDFSHLHDLINRNAILPDVARKCITSDVVLVNARDKIKAAKYFRVLLVKSKPKYYTITFEYH